MEQAHSFAADGGNGGGLSSSAKIALGVGIDIGLPEAIAVIVTCFHQLGRR